LLPHRSASTGDQAGEGDQKVMIPHFNVNSKFLLPDTEEYKKIWAIAEEDPTYIAIDKDRIIVPLIAQNFRPLLYLVFEDKGIDILYVQFKVLDLLAESKLID
jgi:hypothetical protein